MSSRKGSAAMDDARTARSNKPSSLQNMGKILKNAEELEDLRKIFGKIGRKMFQFHWLHAISCNFCIEHCASLKVPPLQVVPSLQCPESGRTNLPAEIAVTGGERIVNSPKKWQVLYP